VNRIAEFDQRFVLERPLTIDDGAGGRTEIWEEVATVWARLANLSGREMPFADSLRSELTHEATLRYRGRLVPTMRLSGSGRILDILAVGDPLRRQDWPVCFCREVPPQ
jgi:SPP1 family predicted phage head-tail adaptor